MKYYSTKNKKITANFRTAVINGIAEDGGLFMPEEIPQFPAGMMQSLPNQSLHEIGMQVISKFAGYMDQLSLLKIIEQAINFNAPVKTLSESLSILELFHGPTLAFKDFGARFLANAMAHFNKDEDKELIILVATSGDTGSAVASSFYGKEGIKVGLLYPSGMVSQIQEKQLTTMGKNIKAFEIEGTFDDCQRLVKTAFLDPNIKEKFNLSSANSINIARLLPQSLYYFYAYGQVKKNLGIDDVIFTVPSGNFGNLTAGLIAGKMGLPVKKYIAAVNSNTVFTEYLQNGVFKPRPARKTLSNAMDVGDPSNFVRIEALFDKNINRIRQHIYSDSATDQETIATIKSIYEQYKYIIDPHGAVGCFVNEKYRKINPGPAHAVVLETAHPAKFADCVEPALNMKIEMPARLAACLNKQKNALKISSDFNTFREGLIAEMK
ncbi:MAG TPA: threonine synthase [Caldithrix sp.]|nr:threonine synthase [Caldithrix sp.]